MLCVSLVLLSLHLVAAQDLTGYTVGALPPTFYLNNPHLKINPSVEELALGWTCFALYTVLMLSAVALYIWEAFNRIALKKASRSGRSTNSGMSRGGRSGGGGGGSSGSADFYVSPFLFAATAFCIMRMIQISVSLAVEKLLVNMQVSFFFESIGNILFLLAFTLVALCWCNLIIRADIYKEFFKRLKIALWVLWGFVAVSLLVAMISFEVYLPDNFGAAAHDGFLLFPNNKTAFAILPVNGYLVKPQAAIITAVDGIHFSFMCEKGFYSCYGFLLGALFAFLGALLVFKLSSNRSRTDSMAQGGAKEKKFRRTVASILFVSIPVSLCFVVIFTFVTLEVATHRHAERAENFITQNLCSEIVALAVLLIHYWRARLRGYVKEKREENTFATKGASTVPSADSISAKSVYSGNSAVSGVEMEMDSGSSKAGDADEKVVTL